ncbi:MAG: glycosyltransferase [Crocinitomicaceae bacterium]|nr:glycosyltransferase [Flavobacteriales bacterium]NQZ38102.1 glycosyltransferase [Crocinitomicaceae bacterium]
MLQEQFHVVIASSWYPNKHQPFVGNFVQRQAMLIATKHQVTVIHTVSHPSQTEFKLEKKTTGNLTEFIVYHPRGKSAVKKYALQKRALKYALTEVLDADLLISHVILPKGIQFARLKKELNCPWVHLEHGSYFRKDYWKSLSYIQKTIIRRTVKRIDHLYAVSENLKQEILTHFPQKEIGILPNHIDTDLFKLAPKNPEKIKKFLHISTLEEATKNPKGLIDACQILFDKGILNFHVTIISDESTKKWKDYAIQHELDNQVSFDGPFDWEDLPRLYQQSDAFILNSNYETFSIVVAESWATGTPVLSTPVGIASKLPKDLGIQTKANNPESLAAAMEVIINEELTFDSTKIRTSSMKYSSERVLEQLETIISKHVG